MRFECFICLCLDFPHQLAFHAQTPTIPLSTRVQSRPFVPPNASWIWHGHPGNGSKPGKAVREINNEANHLNIAPEQVTIPEKRVWSSSRINFKLLQPKSLRGSIKIHYLIPDFLTTLPILSWQVIPFLLDASVVATFRSICGLLLDLTPVKEFKAVPFCQDGQC